MLALVVPSAFTTAAVTIAIRPEGRSTLGSMTRTLPTLVVIPVNVSAVTAALTGSRVTPVTAVAGTCTVDPSGLSCAHG